MVAFNRKTRALLIFMESLWWWWLCRLHSFRW